MEPKLIYGGQATLEDLYRLNLLGFEFVVKDGEITEVLYERRQLIMYRWFEEMGLLNNPEQKNSPVLADQSKQYRTSKNNYIMILSWRKREFNNERSNNK